MLLLVAAKRRLLTLPAFQQMIKQYSSAVVQSVVTKDKAKERPIALNTVELMRVASSGLGMSPQHAMMIAEKLYIQG